MVQEGGGGGGHGRCRVKLVLGTGEVIPCHDRCWTLVYFFFVWKENSRGDSDEYHRFLQFLIVELHKSEVGPSFFLFFFFKNKIFIQKKKKKKSDLFRVKKTSIKLIKYGLSNISSCNDLIHQ